MWWRWCHDYGLFCPSAAAIFVGFPEALARSVACAQAVRSCIGDRGGGLLRELSVSDIHSWSAWQDLQTVLPSPHFFPVITAHVIQLILHFPKQEAVHSLKQAVHARAALKKQVSHAQSTVPAPALAPSMRQISLRGRGKWKVTTLFRGCSWIHSRC